MKLLLVDKASIATFTREEVLRDRFHFRIDYAATYEEFSKKYAEDVYDVVIVDFAVEFGAKALEAIDRRDPKQRVILLSDSEAYSAEKGCAYCARHFNRRRLKPPVSMMELADLIRDFDESNCVYYHD